MFPFSVNSQPGMGHSNYLMARVLLSQAGVHVPRTRVDVPSQRTAPHGDFKRLSTERIELR
jgi:hypothetical protein